MTNIYVVMGTTGEYSDHREWPVAAYTHEADAKIHVLAATARARQLEQAANGHYYDWKKEGKNEFDPDMELDYTGTQYSYFSLPLRKKSAIPKEFITPHLEKK